MGRPGVHYSCPAWRRLHGAKGAWPCDRRRRAARLFCSARFRRAAAMVLPPFPPPPSLRSSVSRSRSRWSRPPPGRPHAGHVRRPRHHLRRAGVAAVGSHLPGIDPRV